MSDAFNRYWADTMTIIGEIPAEKVAAKIIHDLPDLSGRAQLAAVFAFNVKAGLQMAEALEEDDQDAANLERAKMWGALDVIFEMLKEGA